MEAGIKFIVGQGYYYRHIGDSDLVSRMAIISRTEKTSMVLCEHEKKARRYKIHNWDGVEVVRAGNYSMAGSWRANNIVTEDKDEPTAPAPEAPSNLVPFPSKTPATAPESAPFVPALSHAEAVPMVALGRKILTEALSIMGRQTEIDLIEAILDRDHWKMLETLRGAIATGKVGT